MFTFLKQPTNFFLGEIPYSFIIFFYLKRLAFIKRTFLYHIPEVGLDPGETVIAEAGVMNYMEEDITYEARMGDGSRTSEG